MALGVARSTLSLWKQQPEFSERVGQLRAEIERAVLRYRIARRRERVKVLDDLHTGLLTIIEVRGAAMDDEIAGGGTGLLVCQEKLLGAGPNATTVTRNLRGRFFGMGQACIETSQGESVSLIPQGC